MRPAYLVIIALFCLTSCTALPLTPTGEHKLDLTPTDTSTPTITPTSPPTSTPTPIPTDTPIPKPANLALMVFDENKQPIEGALVTLEELKTPAAVQTSDASGRVAWSNLLLTQASLKVRAHGFFVTDLVVPLKPGANQLTVTLERDPFSLSPSDVLKPGEKLIYIEDFQDGVADFDNIVGELTIIDDPEHPGNKLLKVNPQAVAPERSFFYFGPPNLVYFTVQFRFKYIDLSPGQQESYISLFFRSKYSLSNHPYLSELRIIDMLQSKWTYPFRVQQKYASDQWYQIRLEAVSSVLRVFLNDVPMGQATNAWSFSQSDPLRMIIGPEAGSAVYFDDFILVSPVK